MRTTPKRFDKIRARRRAAITIVLAAALAISVTPLAPPAAAENTVAALPFDSFRDIIVDDEREQVYISGRRGVDPDAVVVTDLAGSIVETIPIPGADGLVLIDDVLYVGRMNHASIAKIDPDTFASLGEIALPDVMGGEIALSGSKLWYTEGDCDGWGELAYVDLTTQTATTWPQATRYYCPELFRTSDPDRLLLREGTYVSLSDISTAPPTPVTPEVQIGHGMAMRPGGATFIGQGMKEYNSATLEETGLKYEASPTTEPVDAGPAGLVAGYQGNNPTGDKVMIYGPDGPSPTLIFPVSGWLLGGAFNALGTKLFTVVDPQFEEMKLEILDLSKENLDLTLQTNKSVVDHGEPFTLTAQLERPVDLKNETLDLVKFSLHNGPDVVGSTQVDSQGVGTFDLEGGHPGSYFVRFAGDENYIGGSSAAVEVKVRTVAGAKVLSNYGEANGFKLFHSGDVMKVRGTSAPAYADCNLYFQLQQYVPADAKWRYVTTVSACRDAEGRAVWKRKLNDLGKYRVRTSLYFYEYIQGVSAWIQLKVKR